MKSFLDTVRERVVIYDGAMGTQIQERNPSLDDFWGKENCSEVLVLSRPDIVKDIHAAYFKAGADVVETNTFGGSRIVLAEFDLADKVHEINKRAAELACEVAADFSTVAKPRFVGDRGERRQQPPKIDRRHILPLQFGIEAAGVGNIRDQPVEPANVVLDDAEEAIAAFLALGEGQRLDS